MPEIVENGLKKCISFPLLDNLAQFVKDKVCNSKEILKLSK